MCLLYLLYFLGLLAFASTLSLVLLNPQTNKLLVQALKSYYIATSSRQQGFLQILLFTNLALIRSTLTLTTTYDSSFKIGFISPIKLILLIANYILDLTLSLIVVRVNILGFMFKEDFKQLLLAISLLVCPLPLLLYLSQRTLTSSSRLRRTLLLWIIDIVVGDFNRLVLLKVIDLIRSTSNSSFYIVVSRIKGALVKVLKVVVTVLVLLYNSY